MYAAHNGNTCNYDYVFKIILIGDSGVGKTNMLSQLIKQEFSTTTPPTIGVEFSTISFKINNDVIKAQIWDTAGQERYQAITSAYYRGTHAALIVYDVTDKRTVGRVPDWVMRLNGNVNSDVVTMLVGNKIDLKEKREVSFDVGKSIAEKNELGFVETSALSGENVRKAFSELMKNTYNKFRSTNRISINTNRSNIATELGSTKHVKIKKRRKSCC